MEKYNYRAKLVKVVDGDTIDALIDVGFDIWVKKRIRYKGIDTWESRTRDLDEKKKGLAAKARNKELLEKVSSKSGIWQIQLAANIISLLPSFFLIVSDNSVVQNLG